MDFFDYALLLKLLLIVGVVCSLPYREVVWNVYMEEVGGFLDGELNYAMLKKSDMPLGTPGGSVWVYSALYYITKAGISISLAQLIFSGLYLITFGMILSLYRQAKFPWWVAIPLFASPRILGMYSLSLLNDCWAIFLLYGAITLLAGRQHWKLGCLLYSMSISIKINLLLLTPGLLHILLRSLSFLKVLNCLSVCVVWQLVAGYPFILDDWRLYVSKAFEFKHFFTYRSTENYHFFEKFISATHYRAYMLLFSIVISWLVLCRLRWSTRCYVSVNNEKRELEECGESHEEDSDGSHMMVLTLFESNLAGVLWASLFQCELYISFFHMIPYTLYCIKYPNWLRCAVLGLIAQGFENYPLARSRSVLLVSGIILLILGILFFGGDNHVREASEKDATKVGKDKYDPNNFLPSKLSEVCECMVLNNEGKI